MHLTIFLKHGQTLRFENVTNLKKDNKFYYVILLIIQVCQTVKRKEQSLVRKMY
nr:MAG TPA: hypothetical protein [Caudoviricetes sp.]